MTVTTPHKSPTLAVIDRECADLFAAEAKDGGWTVEIGCRCERSGKVQSGSWVVTVERHFTPGDGAAYMAGERGALRLLSWCPRPYPGSIWGTDSASVGGHAGMTGGYVRMNVSGVGARFAKAAAKACGVIVAVH